jgi:ATP-dependent Lon protease
MEQTPEGPIRRLANHVARSFAESTRDVVSDRMNRPKFGDAARVARDVLSKHIDAIDGKVESGTKVSQQDLYLNKKLRDIRTEIDESLDELWSNPGNS